MKKTIIAYLTKHGESLDADIAKEVGLSLSKMRAQLIEMTVSGDIMSYHSIKFENGRQIEGLRCRISGYIPKAKPGAKAKGRVQLKLSQDE